MTVAHRLNTIMDSDKVLVMEDGRVAEFDHPHLLLQNTSGLFSKMISETGRSNSEHLKTVARLSYEKVINKVTVE